MKKPLRYDPAFVRPLHEARNEFLQVLVSQFSIKAKGGGFDFEAAFDRETPALWRREAKGFLWNQMPAERRSALEKELKSFFDGQTGNFLHDDPSFPFRLGNGGTLPVVRMDGRDYYALFYREARPTGWNIANGGANHVYDLLHPDAIIERELREELIVVDAERKWRYVFDWHDARLRDHPDFALAHQLWMARLHQEPSEHFENVPLPLKWLPAPDSGLPEGAERIHDSMKVRYGKARPVRTGYGLLNINAEDFGIEFDRVAKISVGPDSVFCDGEVVDGKLLNRVVGLFEVEKMKPMLDARSRQFAPDRMFWDGIDRTGEDAAKVIGEYLEALLREFPEFKMSSWNGRKPPLDLCPVTRNVIARHLNLAAIIGPGVPPSPPNAPYDIFLSFGSEDRALANQVYGRLSGPEKLRVFFSDVSINHGLFAEQIDAALDSAWGFVAVGSRPEHFYKSWVKYEWEQFHNDMLARRKGKTDQSPFYAVFKDMPRDELPRPFLIQQTVEMKGDPHLKKLKFSKPGCV